ncbi:MAG: hypothetical protein Q8L48_18665 [Archangium sp.]|nr:hypothetical protein [Archangium sp.]
MSLRLALFVSASVLAMAGCKDTRLGGKGCREDKECGSPTSAYRCEAQTGVCYCRTDDACPGAQFCNVAGFCQDRSGCENNQDCLDTSTFCDTSSGQCLPRGRCSSDLQCVLGEVCDVARSRCVMGCRTNGDCNGTSCRCADVACSCTGTTPEELARCEIGTCDPEFCADSTFCRFGESCGVQPDAGSPRARCYTDYDTRLRPYCDNCTFGGGVSICGTGPNYCLIDTRHPGNSFCGADCASGQSCPRGYACQDVIVVVSQWACTRTNPSCPVNSALPCATDAECRRGGTCAKAPGQTMGYCAGKCAVDEGDEDGFCTCQVDDDCAQETCSAGECSVSRRSCVVDTDCRSIRCVDFQGGGGCFIGSNCAPANGLSCNEVKPQ